MHESRNEREKRQNFSNDPVFASLFYLSKEEGRKEPIGDCKKKIYVSSQFYNVTLPMAGETALAKRSMLNDPKCMVYAMDKKRLKEIPQEAIVQPQFVLDNDYVEIELWKYNPSAYMMDDMVDVVSLVQSLKDVDDERVEMQIEEVMEEYRW